MEFRKYEKVHRLGKEETDGILEGTCIIQEKLDGANASIWLEDGVVHCGSRTRDLTKAGDGFRGLIEYVEGHVGIQNYLQENPSHRLYGEWLVRHTLIYSETVYKKFYLFDVHDGEEFIHPEMVRAIAEDFGIMTVHIFDIVDNPTVEKLMEYAGKSMINDVGEGIVIKNPSFVNVFGEKCNAKIVTEAFKENNGITFGGNNKHSDTYWEMYITNKYMTLPRIEKIMNKLQPEIDKRLDLEHIPRVTQTAYHDMLTEEIWEIAKKVVVVDFKALRRVAIKKAVQIYKDIILGDISVADALDSVADKN